MNLSIVGRQIELTDALKSYIEDAIETLKKYNLDIISVRAVVSADEKAGKKGFSVEFTINLPNKNTIVIKQKDKDLYAACDLAIERAKKVLRRHHDRIREHKAIKPEEIEAAKIIEDEINENSQSDEIVPVELDLYKPLEIEDALSNLKESNRQFLVFIDMDGKTRVLFKKTDGRFGLY
jgi:putative sigma-54 modulation protein